MGYKGKSNKWPCKTSDIQLLTGLSDWAIRARYDDGMVGDTTRQERNGRNDRKGFIRDRTYTLWQIYLFTVYADLRDEGVPYQKRRSEIIGMRRRVGKVKIINRASISSAQIEQKCAYEAGYKGKIGVMIDKWRGLTGWKE